MLNLKTPGVYIEEVSKLPPSVAAVATAIPVFIGYTEMAIDENGDSLEGIPKRITSLLEYEQYFGGARGESLRVDVDQVTTETNVTFETAPGLPSVFLYYSMQLFYANGGGACYVLSIDSYADAVAGDGSFNGAFGDFTNAIPVLEGYDEPTLLVFPDACLLGDSGDHRTVVTAALAHCNKMQDRFTIADVWRAVPGETDSNADVDADFRTNLGDVDTVRYGAGYMPFLDTNLSLAAADADIDIINHTVAGGGNGPAHGVSLDTIQASQTVIYNSVKRYVTANARATVPPSGAVAGAYARVDASRGVWKAPANVGLSNVIGPAILITNDLNDDLNVDTTSGKSVNAIRAFTGKGTLIWGARTLDGNSNEQRYVSTRRFLNMAEESIKKATSQFVFEPNDANTWIKVRGMIENFLTLQWRDGALAGAKPEDAFYVAVGLNKTMSAQDILEGRMIVEIGLAIVRPAEFIILRFIQLLQKS